MQLKKKSIASALGLLAANLLNGAPAMAQADGGDALPDKVNAYDETASELGTLVVDTAVLYYDEANGRVRAVEPVISVVKTTQNGSVLSGKFTYNSLTGASPNGAAPWTAPQTFIAPEQPVRVEAGDTSTGASGTYIAPANQLPIDSGFSDERKAVDLGYSTQLMPDTHVSVGVNGSRESDYRSYSGRVGLTHDLNNKNTTLALGFNYEHDISKPFYGIPVPLGAMGDPTSGRSRVKNVYSLVAGVTQVLTRNWLVQLNYSVGWSKGYHSDPYKLVSLVRSSNGSPFWYINESRPEQRTRQSVYLGSKLALGSAVTDASVRYYHDNWGINSITAELSERLPVGKSFFLEPSARYYHQSAANFYRRYLRLDEEMPAFISADYRLGRFTATTFGLKGGARLTDGIEIYGLAETYKQTGQKYDRSAPGELANLNMFAGMKALSFVTGLKLTFR